MKLYVFLYWFIQHTSNEICMYPYITLTPSWIVLKNAKGEVTQQTTINKDSSNYVGRHLSSKDLYSVTDVSLKRSDYYHSRGIFRHDMAVGMAISVCLLVEWPTTVVQSVQGGQVISPNDFSNPPISLLAPPAGQSSHLSCKISQHLHDGHASQTIARFSSKWNASFKRIFRNFQKMRVSTHYCKY